MIAEPIKPKVIELASGIFTRMVAAAVTITEQGGVIFSVDPAKLAQTSFKLAAAFQKVEDDINADALPKNVGYKLDSADIATWAK